jgi:hypothetical protein
LKRNARAFYRFFDLETFIHLCTIYSLLCYITALSMASFSLGGLSTFNMQHGFVEALVRGFRSGFLLDDAYHHLSQCETLEVGLLFSLYD